MKWMYTEPARGQYDFSQSDPLVTFAAANNMHIRGHNLVWGQQLPAWLVQGTWSRDQLIQIMHDHIWNVVTHFKNNFPGMVTQWDVVNEAVAGPGQAVPNIWENVIGSDYIGMAFQFAHEADPSAQLYYNDYGGEGLGPKSDAINWVANNLERRPDRRCRPRVTFRPQPPSPGRHRRQYGPPGLRGAQGGGNRVGCASATARQLRLPD
jgi:GH35 family endo-1,4-beta-xylanase